MDAKIERDKDLAKWREEMPRNISVAEIAAFKKGWALGGIAVATKLETHEQRKACCCGHCHEQGL